MDTEKQNMERWNVYSLKEYVDLALNNLDEKIEQRFISTKDAVDKADRATDKRFESVNEFRQQLNDQARQFVTKEEYKVAHRAIEDKVEQVNVGISRIENRKEGSNLTLLYIVAISSLIFGLVSIVMNIIEK